MHNTQHNYYEYLDIYSILWHASIANRRILLTFLEKQRHTALLSASKPQEPFRGAVGRERDARPGPAKRVR